MSQFPYSLLEEELVLLEPCCVEAADLEKLKKCKEIVANKNIKELSSFVRDTFVDWRNQALNQFAFEESVLYSHFIYALHPDHVESFLLGTFQPSIV